MWNKPNKLDDARVLVASLLSIGASLVTLNVRHFPMFPKLEPAYSAIETHADKLAIG